VKRGDYEIPEKEVHRTFLFMDVKGFTAFSEKHDPGEVIRRLNEIFHPATESIYRHGGDVDKFIGDCIFAVFHDSMSALRAAREIQDIFQTLDGENNPFQIRMGIHRGRAIHGNVGASERREYTFIGDAVNLTQRLESNCTPGRILVSPIVYEECQEIIPQVEERTIRVKGKEEPVVCFECL